jgi:hypothetical protein
LVGELLEDRPLLATFNVAADVADGATASLRQAISIANSNHEDDIIQLAAGRYDLTLAAGPEVGIDRSPDRDR